MKAILMLDEMPKNCYECRLLIADEICPITYSKIDINDWGDKRNEDCPLKSIPKGHGRLIDAERLKEVLRRNTGYDYHDLIDNAPTIIEADKGEK